MKRQVHQETSARGEGEKRVEEAVGSVPQAIFFQAFTCMHHNTHTCYVPVVFLCDGVNKNEAAGTLENLSGEEGKERTWEAVGLSIPSFFSCFFYTCSTRKTHAMFQ